MRNDVNSNLKNLICSDDAASHAARTVQVGTEDYHNTWTESVRGTRVIAALAMTTA